MEKSVANEEFILLDELFFNTPKLFENFEDFEEKIINVTHNNHQLSPELMDRVKKQFSLYMRDDGAHFQLPIRLDILQKKV